MTKKERADLFISVIDGHKGIIHKIANAYSKSKESKQDLTQEIILQLWKAFENYNPQFKYSTWIYKVALNVSLTHSRKETRRATLFDPIREDLVSLPVEGDPGDWEDKFSRLEAFILELKELDRALLLLYLDERTQKEMAEILGFTETNISTRVGRIKATLRQKFART